MNMDEKNKDIDKVESEEFVENFTSNGELTPIDIVAEITGLTYDEIRSCSKIVCVHSNIT